MGGFGAIPDDVHKDLPQEAGADVPDTAESCRLLNGEILPASSALSDTSQYCLGFSATDTFCIISAVAGNPVAGLFACRDYFAQVRDCNIDDMTGGSKTKCGPACPEGLSARGGACVLTDGVGGDPLSTVLDKGFVAPELDNDDDVPDTAESCRFLNGRTLPASSALSDTSQYCLGFSSTDTFCIISAVAGNPVAGLFACRDYFNKIRECNAANMTGGSKTKCGDMCLGGKAAYGDACIAPIVTDGLLINNPDAAGGELTSGSLIVGLNEGVAPGVVTLKAVPNAGYHISAWTGACANSSQPSPFRPTEQDCVATKVENEPLTVGVRFSYGLLAVSVAVTGDITPARVFAWGLAGFSG